MNVRLGMRGMMFKDRKQTTGVSVDEDENRGNRLK